MASTAIGVLGRKAGKVLAKSAFDMIYRAIVPRNGAREREDMLGRMAMRQGELR